MPPSLADSLTRLIAEGTGEEDEEADRRLRAGAVAGYLALLDRPKLPRVLLKVRAGGALEGCVPQRGVCQGRQAWGARAEVSRVGGVHARCSRRTRSEWRLRRVRAAPRAEPSCADTSPGRSSAGWWASTAAWRA